MTLKFEDGPIAVELIPTPKGSKIGYTRDEDGAKEDTPKGDAAINAALEVVFRTAQRVKATLDALGEANQPTEFEVDFGIKLDENGKAMIAHSGLATHFRVRLAWKQEED